MQALYMQVVMQACLCMYKQITWTEKDCIVVNFQLSSDTYWDINKALLHKNVQKHEFGYNLYL